MRLPVFLERGSMIKTILFDLDGTIVNTNELIIASFLHALEGETPEPYTRHHLIPHFGKPLIEQLKLFSGKEDVEYLVQKYRSFNIAKHDDLVMEFPYVKEVMDQLHRSGIRMGVVTSKIRRTVLLGLQRFGLDGYLETIVTVDDVKEPKPSPEGIKMAMTAMGADPASTLMVGDSQFDILAAQNAGIASAGVSWTLKGEEFLQSYGPTYMLRDMRDLLDICGIKRDEA